MPVLPVSLGLARPQICQKKNLRIKIQGKVSPQKSGTVKALLLQRKNEKMADVLQQGNIRQKEFAIRNLVQFRNRVVLVILWVNQTEAFRKKLPALEIEKKKLEDRFVYSFRFNDILADTTASQMFKDIFCSTKLLQCAAVLI